MDSTARASSSRKRFTAIRSWAVSSSYASSARRLFEDPLLGRLGLVPVRQAAEAGPVCLAADCGWCPAIEDGPAGPFDRGGRGRARGKGAGKRCSGQNVSRPARCRAAASPGVPTQPATWGERNARGAVPRTEFGRQKSPCGPGTHHPEPHLDKKAGRCLLLGTDAGMSIERHPNPRLLLVRKPHAGHPVKSFPDCTSVGFRDVLISSVNRA